MLKFLSTQSESIKGQSSLSDDESIRLQLKHTKRGRESFEFLNFVVIVVY